MRMMAAAVVVLLGAACAMQPARSGPWPPLPTTLPQAPPPTSAARPVAGPTLAEATAPPAVAPPISLLPAWPEGWRAPSDEELNGPHAIRRGDSPSAYLSAEGDFNADGRGDRAVLLVSDARDQYGVFIFDGTANAYPVLVGGPAAAVEALGLSPNADAGLTFFLFGSSRFAIAWDGTAYAVAALAE
jgi:hypothetical protein